MPSNIEVKARLGSKDRLGEVVLVAEWETVSQMKVINQVDTFFNVVNGRLKLREEETGAKLIWYSRPNGPGPKLSIFNITLVPDPMSMVEVLKNAMGISMVVKKRRELYWAECELTGLRTRIHIDAVEGLGDFIEFEVIVPSEEKRDAAVIVADKLIEKFGIKPEDVMTEAYADYLAMKTNGTCMANGTTGTSE